MPKKKKKPPEVADPMATFLDGADWITIDGRPYRITSVRPCGWNPRPAVELTIEDSTPDPRVELVPWMRTKGRKK